VLTNDEIRWLWHACTALGVVGDFVRMLMLTGQRRNEVAGITRSELVDREWIIPARRTKNNHEHRLALPDAALQLLSGRPRVGDAGFYFTSRGDKPISSFTAAKAQVDAAMLAAAKVAGVSEISSWTFHDIRRSVASGLARLGVELHVTEALLNHRSGEIQGVAAVYNRHDYAREKEQALARWAAELDRIVNEHPDSKVVLFRG
jgi:integrase